MPLPLNLLYHATAPNVRCCHWAGSGITSASAHRLTKETAESHPTQALISALMKKAGSTVLAPVHSTCTGGAEFLLGAQPVLLCLH